MATMKSKKVFMLKPEQIQFPAESVRKNPEKEDIKQLAESIRVCGILQPVSVKKEGNGYRLISGERRLLAALQLKLRRIPCLVYNLNNAECVLFSLTENIQRQKPDYISEAMMIEGLMRHGAISCSAIAFRLGITVASLTDKLRLLELGDEIIARLKAADLCEEYAKLLLILPDYQRLCLIDSIIEDNLSLEKTKKLVEEKLNPEIKNEKPAYEPALPHTEPKPIRKFAIGDERMFANSLSKLTDTLKTAGFSITTRKTENDKYTEYKVRIKKESTDKGEYKQLSCVTS